ncbi:radial spoke head protein 4 homolog A [Cloeon dipterum]|uniref:radial spoke head protein 4 homolog A n=1 Tax=Cloeon dipterum TaxID=197152 RepID=UPI0032209FB9
MEAIEVTEEDVREAKNALDPRVVSVLTKLVSRLLHERPPDAFDILEQLVISAKNDEGENQSDLPPEIPLENAKLMQSFYNPEHGELKELNAAWLDRPPQVMPWTSCREHLSMQRLQQQHQQIYRLRFWGCIWFKWYVLEAELTPQGFVSRAEEVDAAAKQAQALTKAAWEEMKKEAEETGKPLPEPPFLSDIPIEPSGTGVNSMVYLVSSELGLPESWTWLPDITPEDILKARQIVRFPEDIEGDCSASGLGKAVILRAQIARINASTRVAPQGMFKMKKKLAPGEEEDDEDEEDEDEEEDEENEEPKEARLNARFKLPALKQLVDLNKWVHITSFILQSQGRVKWWNPNPDADEDEEDEEEEEEGEKKAGPEKCPKPLSPIAQDEASPHLAQGFPTCWALRKVSVLGPPAVVARSLIWPGSITLFYSGQIEHIYIGWGVKSSSNHYCPPLVPEVAVEPAELLLSKDPTVEEEKAAQAQDDEDEDEEKEGEEDEDD